MNKVWLRLMRIGRYGCHQIPKRSFFIKGYQMPICARCTGLTVGYVIGIFLYIQPLYALLMIIPTTLDGLIQLKTSYESTNLIRFTTGLLAGIGYLSLLKAILIFIF